MTTIAWDGATLAGDTLSVTESGWKDTVHKLFRLPDGSLYGGAGDYAMVLRLHAWLLRQPREEEELDDVTGTWNAISALWIRPDGQLWRLVESEGPPVFVKTDRPFLAIGSGRDYAMMAMHLGKDAREAVCLAAVYDHYTGGGIDTLTRLDIPAATGTASCDSAMRAHLRTFNGLPPQEDTL